MEGGATRAHTILSLSLSPAYSNTLWACADRQCKYRRTHAHALRWHPLTPAVDGKLDPQCPEAERQKDRDGDQWTQWCVCYLHPNPQFSLSLCLHPPFPQFQAANSAVCQLLLQSREYTWEHSFHLHLLRSTRGPRVPADAGHLQSEACRPVSASKKLRNWTCSMMWVHLSSLTFCVLNYTFTRVAGLHADFENVIWKMHPATRTSGQSWGTHTLRWNILLDEA